MLESGQELSARFVLVRALGAGGSGSVWLAQDKELGRFVAVKVLSDELMQDAAAVAALQRECTRLTSLDHPNIVRVEGLHRSPSHAWIAMEYLSGGDLSSWRGRGCAEILRITLPVAEALAYAHGAGVVHRDVKPANVLLTSDSVPKLTDFGIALAVNESPAERAGRGSIFTMSPQQLDGAAATASDDVYGFGALLYELLSGYPPFHPDVTPDRIRTERPATLGSMPPRVQRLVEQCLSKSPQDRPADMQAVVDEMNAAIGELPAVNIVNTGSEQRPALVPPSLRVPGVAQSEPLRSEWRRPTHATHSADEARRQGFRRGLGAAAIVLAIVGIGFVFFALPRWFPDTPRAQPTQTAKMVETPKVQTKKETDFAALARAKLEAEEARAEIDPRLGKLRARAVDQWGGAEFKQATVALEAGDRDFAAREYTTARDHFKTIAPLLEVLEKRATDVLAQQLAAGSRALAEGRSADAKTAFELATKLEPANAAATRGLKRATTLDEVLALVATGEREEKEGNINAAAETFRKALALDGDMTRASEGLARVGARVSSDAYASAMARGFAALASSRYGEARSSFNEAVRIRPGSPEAAQALKQIEQEERTRTIAARLEEARQLESSERWTDALKEYRAVVQLDSTVSAASEGVARTTPRAELNEELELYLTQPERLFSVPVRNAAKQTLQRARNVAAAGPVLQKQIATLENWLARADVPVQVAIQSDNITQVTIYRVGALGSFDQRSLELPPGNYTVVGTRPGYRDVRREINVVPGAALQPVVVRCEEKI